MSVNIVGSVTPDGLLSALAGCNSGVNPSLIEKNQYSLGVNVTARNGFVTTRPGWIKRFTTFGNDIQNARFTTGNPQGLGYYNSGANNFLMASLGGRIFSIDPLNNFKVQENTPPEGPNAADEAKAYMCQADDYFIIQDGISKPIIIHGLTSKRAGKDEVPVGTAMAYGWGRLWVTSNNGQDFVAGDIQGGPTSVISFTETQYFAEGGAFRIPATVGRINSMAFIPLQDTATGQGQLLIGADFGVASINGGIPRSQWKETQIQQIALLDIGWCGQDNRVLLNGDIFYRARDGIRSYRMARAQQGYNGNTPQSNEVSYWLNTDTQQFLKYGSGVYFDGRILMTTSPVWKGTYCYHQGLVVLDSQPQQSIQSKAPPAWDGMWDGLNIVQITKGTFNNQERCFALVRKIDDTIISSIKSAEQSIAQDPVTLTVDDSSVFTEGTTYQTGQVYFKVLSIDDDFHITVNTVTHKPELEDFPVGQTITRGDYNEIWELTKDSPFDVIENENKLIQSKLWTRSFTHDGPFNLKELSLGEMWVEDVIGTVNWSVKFRPDQYACMLDWKSGSVCGEYQVCGEQCTTLLNRHPTYKPRIKFGAPTTPQCNQITGLNSILGFEFQWLVEWEGHWKIRGIRETCINKPENPRGDC